MESLFVGYLPTAILVHIGERKKITSGCYAGQVKSDSRL